MKHFSRFCFLLSVLVLFLFILSGFASESSPPYQGAKIDIAQAVIDGNVIISGTPSITDHGISFCFDGQTQPEYISDGSDIPTWVQVSFVTAPNINRIRVLVGELGFDHIKCDWWLDAADTEDDLNNKTGSYCQVIARQYGGDGMDWVEADFPTTCKKVWRFYVKKKTYDDNAHIVELELWAENSQ